MKANEQDTPDMPAGGDEDAGEDVVKDYKRKLEKQRKDIAKDADIKIESLIDELLGV